MADTKMTGWKSKAGAILGAVGAALLAAAQVVPPTHSEFGAWCTFAGTLIAAAGASLLGVGIAHKIEKGNSK